MGHAYRRRSIESYSVHSHGTPYLERSDRQLSRPDRSLLNAWGSVYPYLPGMGRRRLERLVQRVEDMEGQLDVMTDNGLRQRADGLRKRLVLVGQGSDEVAVAFSLVREAARRHVGMRHYRVQLLGGAAMMDGALAEMQTGEGKSLTAL